MSGDSDRRCDFRTLPETDFPSLRTPENSFGRGAESGEKPGLPGLIRKEYVSKRADTDGVPGYLGVGRVGLGIGFVLC